METVKLRYRKWGLFPTTRTIDWPEGANECTRQQLLRLQRILDGSAAYGYLEQVSAAIELLGSKRLYFRMLPEDKNRLRELALWVFSEGLVHNKTIMAIISIDGKTLHGPADRMQNCSFLEFVYADQFAAAYVRHESPEMLDRLLATLWRPRKSKALLQADDYNGDPRRQFNAHLMEVHARQVGSAPHEVKMVALWYFLGCKAYICQLYDDIFSGGDDSSEPAEDPYTVMQREIAKTGTLGDLEKVQNENLYNVLEFWRDLIRSK